MSNLRPLANFHPEKIFRLENIIQSLQQPLKILPSKLFYDERGSKLFDKICQLPEYYLTRIEQTIMDESVEDMCRQIGENVLLVELGSGSSLKTRALLDHLKTPAGYIPVDISATHLVESAARIANRYPALEVMPVAADYEQEFTLPAPTTKPTKTVIYFPGSTVGNFHPPEVVLFLNKMRAICGQSCEILIGVDMKKDAGILHRAYNDCDGVTAAFNLNILNHLNEVYDADFNLDAFKHIALYNSSESRIEMHLESLCQQSVKLNNEEIHFETGENIWTESSYKYTIEDFSSLAAEAGFRPSNIWMDYNRFFSVFYLVPTSDEKGT